MFIGGCQESAAKERKSMEAQTQRPDSNELGLCDLYKSGRSVKFGWVRQEPTASLRCAFLAVFPSLRVSSAISLPRANQPPRAFAYTESSLSAPWHDPVGSRYKDGSEKGKR